MTDKQRKFADEYLIDCNATRAYKVVYDCTNERSARTLASRLLAKVDVKAYISEQLDKISNKKTADVKEVMEYLTAVMRGESQGEVVVVEGTGEGRSKAKRLLKAPEEKDKLKAAELLGKRYNMFKENVNVDVEHVVIKNDLME